MEADDDKSSLKRIVKNYLFGPPPSMAGSPSKVILRGFVKSNFCLKIEMLSVRMDDRFTVSRVGAPGRGLNFSKISLRVDFCSSSFERVSSVKNVSLHESIVNVRLLLVFIQGNFLRKENLSFRAITSVQLGRVSLFCPTKREWQKLCPTDGNCAR